MQDENINAAAGMTETEAQEPELIPDNPNPDPFIEDANEPFDEPAETPDPGEPETTKNQDDPDEPIGFVPRFDADPMAKANLFDPPDPSQNFFYDGDAAAAAMNEQRQEAEARFESMNRKFDLSNKKLKYILFGGIGLAVVAIIAIIILLCVGTGKKEKPIELSPEPVIQITRPDAVGMKKADEPMTMADPGELSLALSNPEYQPENPGYLTYAASIPSSLQLYHGIGAYTDLNKFQATASTYAALIKSELLQKLNLFHDIRYTDYRTQNHPEPEFVGTNYSILSASDYYQTHNYELMMDSDGCQVVTYSYTFNLKNTAVIEEYDFSDYLTCLRVLTSFDITNNDVLYLLRVSMNNYQNNNNESSTVQIVSSANPADYILFEQVPGVETGSYSFLITAYKNLGDINAPDFSQNNSEVLEIPELLDNPSPVENEIYVIPGQDLPEGVETLQPGEADPVDQVEAPIGQTQQAEAPADGTQTAQAQ